IRVLRDLARDHAENLGNRAMLDSYHQKRIADIRARVAGITMLNRTSMISAQPLRDVRARGLDALYTLKPVRTTLMQLGLGARGA
ncbi:MAG TPA: UbiH/UbiF family hydroxylase, partial [Marivita sp.]|nr:UbiH/UbiF family hydroxylase [Marivita sp.]